MHAWVIDESKTADFGDSRLNSRYRLLLGQLSDKPTLSIPAACAGPAEMAAAYRFFDNERVSVERILKPHIDATLDRIRQQRVVLIPQDTTELDLTRREETVGGPLNDSSRRGLFAHPQLAMTPDRLPLGVIGATIWGRDAESFERPQAEKRRERKAKPITEKESHRWLAGYEQACAVAEQTPGTTVVSIADSEGDIYEYYLAGESGAGRRAEWIVRACQDRALMDADGNLLRQQLLEAKRLGRLDVEARQRHPSCGDADKKKRKQGRESRRASVTVQAAVVTLRPPHRPEKKMPPVQVNAILVREERPPTGEEPIEWLLLTSLPIDSFAAAQTAIDYYCCRWEIEVYFRVLKGGCRVEDLQLETTARFEACLALYMIVAWRVLHLLMLGRTCPDMTCEAVLGEAEWKAVYQIVTGKQPPRKVPTIGEMIGLIAKLGGYMGRKHDGPPGPKAVWIGLQRMRDFAIAWSSFGP